MSLPQGQPHQDRPCDPARPRARQTDAGIARGPGIFVAAVTAVIVFAIGHQLIPVKQKQPAAPPPAPAPIAETQPPAPQPASDAAAAVATTPPAAEAGAVGENNADAGATAAEKTTEKTDESAEPKKAEKPEKGEKAEAPEKSAGDEGSAGADTKPIDKQRQADKDLAREAWRRNRPDVSVNGSKTAIMVPIRGSIKGADFRISDKRRKVIVTLPKAVSMVTLRVYNLKHPLFKKVWIDQDEANAQPADGTKLRFVLSQTLDPQVEITEDFVRVTIRRPESGDEPRGEKHVERAEKHGERTEKHGASSNDVDGAASEKD